MAVVPVLSQAQATYENFFVSLQQYFSINVKTPYDTNIAARTGISKGAALGSSGLWVQDTLGLGIMPGDVDDPSIYVRVPTLAYCLDDGREVTGYAPIGIGDQSGWERHAVRITCLPSMKLSTDGSMMPSLTANAVLRTYVTNALTRTLFMPILDINQPVGQTFATIHYARIEDVRWPQMGVIKNMLVSNKDQFRVEFTFRIAVMPTNG